MEQSVARWYRRSYG